MTPNDKTEEVKRLQPKPDVLRELFLKSGNLCAFPGCSHLIMNQNGLMVGEICHIEAAEKGGERFNSSKTNEERRVFSNLLLMCHDHHVETNDVVKYSVERMQEIKANHEARVSEFIEKTLFDVTDQTKLSKPKKTINCGRLNKLLNWNHNQQELAQDAAMLNEDLLTKLSKVPLPARQLLEVIVQRATPDFGCSEMVLEHEVRLACGLDSVKMGELCTILQKYGLIEEGGEDDYGHGRICLSDLNGWPVWKDFRTYSKEGHATLHELIVDLNFSLLDEPPN